MRCFSVIALFAACISAATCYGGYGGYSQFGQQTAAAASGAAASYQQQQQQQQSSSEYQASEQYSASESSNQYAAAATQQAGAYGAGYGAAYGGAASAAYGGAAGAYGGAAGAYGAGYGAAGAYGAAASSGYAAGQAQSNSYSANRMAYSKSTSSAVSSSTQSAAMASSASAASYSASLSYYPNLARNSFFASCFNAASDAAMSSYSSLIDSSFNYESTINSLCSSNSLFKSYLMGATGFNFNRFSQSELSQVYGVFNVNKAAFAGLVRRFARHGYFYKTDFATATINCMSEEIFSNVQRFSSFANVQAWNQVGLTKLFSHSYYNSRIAAFCGLQSFDEVAVRRTLQSYFSTNLPGTMLFFRHLLLGRIGTSCSYSQYQSLSASSYSSLRSQFGYYGGFYEAYQKQSSFSRSSSYSASSNSLAAASGAASYGAGSYGAYDASSSVGAASSAMSSSSYSSSSSSVSSSTALSQYYGSSFAQSQFMQGIYALESCDTSTESKFYSPVFGSGFNFASAYGPFLQNKIFSRYLYGCFGGFYDVKSQMQSQLFSMAQRYPGYMARTTRLFAKNGAFFTSKIGSLFLNNESAFFFSSAINQYRSQFLSTQNWSSCGLSYLFKSKYYQRKLASFFGFQSFEASQVSSALSGFLSQNFAGGMLALRHMIFRKSVGQSFSASAYARITSAASYSSMISYKCPFYSSWSSYYRQYSSQAYSRSASYRSQQSSAASSSSSSSMAYSAGAAQQQQAAAGGYSAAAGGYYM